MASLRTNKKYNYSQDEIAIKVAKQSKPFHYGGVTWSGIVQKSSSQINRTHRTDEQSQSRSRHEQWNGLHQLTEQINNDLGALKKEWTSRVHIMIQDCQVMIEDQKHMILQMHELLNEIEQSMPTLQKYV